jgi:hypothetical protein
LVGLVEANDFLAEAAVLEDKLKVFEGVMVDWWRPRTTWQRLLFLKINQTFLRSNGGTS